MDDTDDYFKLPTEAELDHSILLQEIGAALHDYEESVIEEHMAHLALDNDDPEKWEIGSPETEKFVRLSEIFLKKAERADTRRQKLMGLIALLGTL